METVVYIPLCQLRESPFNPRKVYPEAELQELAASIGSQGVLQPIVVRPLPEQQTDIEHTHEIVFGHRRFRASALAEMEEVPCLVRELSDRAAAVAQAHENAKRADVTPFEEADSFAFLMQQHGMSADQVAEAVGKSRSYVYGRLKLSTAAAVVRQACAEQGLSTEIALELARIANPKLQAEALKRVKSHYGDGWMSTRDAKAALKHRYVFDLQQAPFDPGDPTLVASAGACHACPRMSLNDPDLQTEPGSFCIDHACHQSKVLAFRERHLEEMAAAGHTVLEGEAAKALLPDRWSSPPPQYIKQSNAGRWASDAGGRRYMGFQELCERSRQLGIATPTRTLVVLNPTEEPITLLASADVEQWHQALGLAGADDDAARDDPYAHWSPVERLIMDRDASARIRKAAVLGLRDRPRTVDDLRLIVTDWLAMTDGDFGIVGEWLGIDALCEAARAQHEQQAQTDDDFDEPGWYFSWTAKTATADELALVMVAVALDNSLNTYGTRATAAHKAALAEHYGVDVMSHAAPATPISPPSGRCAGGEEGAADAEPAARPNPKKQPRAARANQMDKAADAAPAEQLDLVEAN